MSRDPRLVLVACCLAMLAVGENSTAIMAALPAMSSGLGLDPATVEWAVNAYLLAAAAFIILGGEAADMFGPLRSSAAGIVLFALAVAGALAGKRISPASCIPVASASICSEVFISRSTKATSGTSCIASATSLGNTV